MPSDSVDFSTEIFIPFKIDRNLAIKEPFQVDS